MISFPPSNPTPDTVPGQDKSLRQAAEQFEAGFLAEMLQSAGLGKKSNHFGGGAGEDQFASFLVEEQARQMVRAGGIGLAESLFLALKDKSDA